MKRHHILLILLLVGIAAFLLNEKRNLRNTETNVRAELELLRTEVKKSPGAAASSTQLGKSSNSRPPVIDPMEFMAEFRAFLGNAQADENGKSFEEFTKKFEAFIATAPMSKLKEICELLETSYNLDLKSPKMARQAWFSIMSRVVKSDPVWALAKFDEVASASKVPIDVSLDAFKRWGSMDHDAMNPVYANALTKWLDDTQAAGRIEASDPIVAELRSRIAAAQGKSSEAVKQIAQLPYTSQRKVAVDYIEGLQTPEARRQAMEELSTALHHQNFPHAVRALAAQQGFKAAREIVGAASLTPEKHDLAAASIASANIGTDTPAKAKWLLDSLRSKDNRPITEFADRWTHADYQGAAQWMNSLPPGRQRDAAVAGFAPVAARIDGPSAVDWALTVTDATLRDSCLAYVYRNWKSVDLEAADAHLKKNGTPSSRPSRSE